MQDTDKLKLARSILPVTDECAYLDTGSVGPVSTVFAETLHTCTVEDTRTGRARDFRWERIDKARERVRQEVALLLTINPEQLELTRGTADAVRQLVNRFPWQHGDEIVSTRLEYPACGDALADTAQANSLELRLVDVPDNADKLDWLEAALSDRTRLIALSAVGYTNGQRLPLEKISAIARARGILTLVDAAQLAGALPLDLAAIPVDFIAMPLQKWLCGPEGLGALFVRDSETLAVRGDSAVHGWPLLEATAVHLAWLRENLGWQWIHQRTRALAEFARATVEPLESVRLLTPNSHAALISMACAPGASENIVEHLETQGIVVRHRPELDLIRIATAFFNTEGEIEKFSECIRR